MAATFAPLLKIRSLILAKIESTYNVDPVPVATADALLAADPNYQVDVTVLERNIIRATISDSPVATGRQQASLSFTHELRGSGAAATAPKLGVLFRACGCAQTQVTSGAANQVANFIAADNNTGPTVAGTGQAAPTDFYGSYRITVVLGGASAAAKVRVTQAYGIKRDTAVLPAERFDVIVKPRTGSSLAVAVNTTDPLSVVYTVTGSSVMGDEVIAIVGGIQFSYQNAIGAQTLSQVATALAAIIDAHALIVATPAAGVITVTFAAGAAGTTVTTAVTNIALGSSSATIQFAWTGSLILNDYYMVNVMPVGFHYSPRDDVNNFESITLYYYEDGILKVMTGSRGTFNITAESGQYARVEFRFQGQYNEPRDEALPTTVTYEKTVPLQVENANLLIDGSSDLVSQSVNLDIGNTINLRESISGSDGYEGALITDRSCSGSFTPEATKESQFALMNKLAASTVFAMSWALGITAPAGQRIFFGAHSTQFGQVQEADRNNISTRTVNLRYSKPQEFNRPDFYLIFY